jgi:hypothetical protein
MQPTAANSHNLLADGWFTLTVYGGRLSLMIYAPNVKSLPVVLKLPKLSRTVTVKLPAMPAVTILRPCPLIVLVAKQPLATTTCIKQWAGAESGKC